MGKPRKKPPVESSIAVAEPPETTQPPAFEHAPEPKRPSGRPRAGTGPAIPSARNFFEKMADIKREDWGTRANIHLYRLEPFTDRLRSGTVVFIMKYAEPIDETRILMDHGSGRYRAMLTFRKPSSEKGDELDRHDFDLLNIKFPPKIPKGEWVDDPRNKKWEWARNFYENGDKPPAQPSQTDSVVETMRTLNEIRRDVREEMQPPAAPAQPSMLDTIRAVKEILPPPAAPTENALLNTVVTLLTSQIAAQQAETAALRQELRERQSAPATPFNIDTVVTGFEKAMPLIERLWPAAKAGVDAAAQRAVRSNMTGWQEFIQPMLPKIIEMPLWGIIAQGMMMKSQQQPQAGFTPPHPNPSHALPQGPQLVPQQQPDTRGPLVQFLDEIVRPMMNHLQIDGDGAEIGSEFAAWLYDGYSADPRYDQAISTARMMGTPTLIGLYKQSPYWTQLGSQEGKFTAFLEAMMKWEPPPDPDEDDGKIIDLTQPGAHA